MNQTPEQAAVNLYPQFQREAARLCPDNEFGLQQDIAQEMAISVLMQTEACDAHYMREAIHDARDFMKRERMEISKRMDFSKTQEPSKRNKFETVKALKRDSDAI